MADFDLSGYVDVATRIALFKEKHPEGSLQPANPAEPYRIEVIGDGHCYIVYVAAAYRDPKDRRPGIGVAWEEFPGRTPYTKHSELQNAETSAWGRAIVAALAADTRVGGVASRDEVRNRQRSEPAGYDGPPLASDEEVSTLKTAISNAGDEARAAMNAWWKEHYPGEGAPTSALIDLAWEHFRALTADAPAAPESGAVATRGQPAPETPSSPPSGPETTAPELDRYKDFRKDDLTGAARLRGISETGTVAELRARLESWDAEADNGALLGSLCSMDDCGKAASMVHDGTERPYCPDHEPF
jgi:hypothetical protein